MNSSHGKIFINPHNLNPISCGSMTGFSDHLLAPSAKKEIKLDAAAYVVLLPVTGDLFFKIIGSESGAIEVGQLKVCRMSAASIVEIINPYESESIKFIQVTIKDESITHHFFSKDIQYVPETANFDLKTGKNGLIQIYTNSGVQDSEETFCVFIGQFDGRSEAAYHVKNKEAYVFFYIIAGAFEIGGRLLHAEDGLALWDVENVELEALSENAIVLLLEL